MPVKKETKHKLYLAIISIVLFVLLMLFMFSGDNFDLLKSLFTSDHSN